MSPDEPFPMTVLCGDEYVLAFIAHFGTYDDDLSELWPIAAREATDYGLVVEASSICDLCDL